jgi:resuscitation-promoting factor RpfB
MRTPIVRATVVATFALLTLAACGPPNVAERPGAATPSPVSTTPQPKIERTTATETQVIPFETTTQEDPSLDKGRTVIRTPGVNGVKTLTYEVTLADGVQTDRKLLSSVVTTAPTTQVTAVGTKAQPAPAAQCDPNYSGACVPIASDVDCAGGGGNGPAYVRGPVRVIGSDIYDLDRDGDGIGCE